MSMSVYFISLPCYAKVPVHVYQTGDAQKGIYTRR
jgi:hypothetical protein